MVSRVKVFVIEHYDTTVESVAAEKEEQINNAIDELELEGSKIIGLTETVVHTNYSTSDPDNPMRDYHHTSSGTVVTILYQTVRKKQT